VNKAVRVEHGILVRPVFRPRLHERGHERGLPGEAPPRKHDRTLPDANNSSMDEDMVGGMQRDVHAQLGVENPERESQLKRARDGFLIAHDVQKPIICGVLDEREAATLGRMPHWTGARRQEIGNNREVLRIGADRHCHTERLYCHRLCRAFTCHIWKSSSCSIRLWCTFIWMMNDALIVARLCLAVVFLIAGVGKLADRPGTRQALADFDVPRRLADPLQLLLPVAELAVATALLFPTTARWGAVGSLVLLALFVVGLTRVLRRGEAPDCHCFGQVHSKPASWTTVARNFALALPAAYVALAGPGPSLTTWIADTDATDLGLIAIGTLAALATIASVLLWRENRRLRSTDNQVAAAHRQIGALAPHFTLPCTAGGAVSLQDLLADDRACLLTFVSPGCGPCKALLPELARWHDTITERLALTLVTTVKATEAEQLAHEHALNDVLIDEQSTVSNAYGATAVPSAVLVASDGTVRSALVAGPVAIESLIRLALQDETHRLSPGIANNRPIRATGVVTA
jgi:uncharacterized membrane protein YphA (DoxX/SURF4 family)/peroxiredoxin